MIIITFTTFTDFFLVFDLKTIFTSLAVKNCFSKKNGII